MLKIVALCFAALALGACAFVAQTPSALTVNLGDLTSTPERFVGKRISTAGCAQYHAHGAHISPCGEHTWKEVLIIDDAPNFSASAEIAKAALNFRQSPYAEFSGVIHKSRSEINPSRTVYTLVVDQVRNVAEHEP